MDKRVYEQLNQKIIDRITIDLDSYRSVPRVLVKALEIFDIKNVKLYKTASGTGFRIEIIGKFTPLENIYYRCLLDDDPYRLRFAIRRYLGTGNVDLLDIAFYYKEQIGGYQGFVTEIDLRELIDDEILNAIRDEYVREDLYKILEERLLKFVDKINLWTIVIPAKKEYIEKIRNNFRKYKILKDPYYDDRVIFYKVSNDNLVEKFKELGIPVITYKVKEVSQKEVDITEELLSP